MNENTLERLRSNYLPFLVIFLIGSLGACDSGPADRATRPEPEGRGVMEAPSDEGREVVEAEVVESGELPSALPPDVPVYPGASAAGGISAGPDSAFLTFETSDTESQVRDFYRDALTQQGWQLDTAGTPSSFRATKGERGALIRISRQDSLTTFVVMLD